MSITSTIKRTDIGFIATLTCDDDDSDSVKRAVDKFNGTPDEGRIVNGGELGEELLSQSPPSISVRSAAGDDLIAGMDFGGQREIVKFDIVNVDKRPKQSHQLISDGVTTESELQTFEFDGEIINNNETCPFKGERVKVKWKWDIGFYHSTVHYIISDEPCRGVFKAEREDIKT